MTLIFEIQASESLSGREYLRGRERNVVIRNNVFKNWTTDGYNYTKKAKIDSTPTKNEREH